MQCRQAKLRLAEYNSQNLDPGHDQELMDHLSNCPDCARDLGADRMLSGLFETAGADDTQNMVSMDRQKVEVEKRAVSESPSTAGKRSPVSAVIIAYMKKPALSFGTTLSLVVLIFLTLIPFGYHRTVGYTVTMEGVNHELAGDIERICGMLSSLGLGDTEVDILGCDSSCRGGQVHECDTTCSLRFIELKTRGDAQKIIDAFAQVDPADLTTDVKPVRARTSGSLLDRANETILQRGSGIN